MKNYYEQLKKLCNEKGTTVYAIEKATGVSNGCYRKWGKSSPSADKLIEIADLLGVSLDYLVGRNIKTQETPIEISESHRFAASTILEELPELFKEQRFVDTAKIYNELPDEYRERVCGMVIGIAVGLGLNIEKILER